MQRNAAEKNNKIKKKKNFKFSINDHLDVLTEILRRLDGPSLCAAACVCRLWCALARNDDSLWEHLCLRHASSPPPSALRSVVLALGGYKRLYMLCLRPLLATFNRRRSHFVRRVSTLQDHLQLSLSLFSVDCYERSGRIAGDAAAAAPSLRFLCKPVNV
ncbi:F-box protein SNE-like [Momordica charantia]|uniref:F-box protein SNE-like n=1 Tax=Momordica charantia TaxID=3673 RepID=A0A6J1C339_MOMCH|nr:F-box protein SNE-like [Momordica charantia]